MTESNINKAKMARLEQLEYWNERILNAQISVINARGGNNIKDALGHVYPVVRKIDRKYSSFIKGVYHTLDKVWTMDATRKNLVNALEQLRIQVENDILEEKANQMNLAFEQIKRLEIPAEILEAIIRPEIADKFEQNG